MTDSIDDGSGPRPGFLRSDSELVGRELPPLPTLRPLLPFRRFHESLAPTWLGRPTAETVPSPAVASSGAAAETGDLQSTADDEAPADPLAQAKADAVVSEFAGPAAPADTSESATPTTGAAAASVTGETADAARISQGAHSPATGTRPDPVSAGNGSARPRSGRVLVVGAGAAGAAIAVALAGLGWRVAVSDSRRDNGTGIVAALPGDGPHLFVPGADSDPLAVNRMLGEALEGLGGLDVVVVTPAATAAVETNTSAQDWAGAFRELLTLTLVSAAAVVHKASRLFNSLDVRGRIVLVATGGISTSTAMDRAITQGLIGLATGLAEDLVGQGVEVTVISAASSAVTGPLSVPAAPGSSPLAGAVSWLVTRSSEAPAPAHLSLSG